MGVTPPLQHPKTSELGGSALQYRPSERQKKECLGNYLLLSPATTAAAPNPADNSDGINMNKINYYSMFVSIDESGDIGRYPPSPSPFFIITAILTEDKHNLDSVISRIRRKFKKNGKTLPSELKHSNSDKLVIKAILESILSRDCQIISIGIDKRRLNYSRFASLDRIYIGILHQVFYEIIAAYPFESSYTIHIDRGMASSRYDAVCSDFNDILHTVNRTSAASVKIECLPSEVSEAVQAADFIAGTIHTHYRLEDMADDYALWEKIAGKSLKINLLESLR